MNINRNFGEYTKLINQKMQQISAQVLQACHVSDRILNMSKTQFSIFMENYPKWMGNVNLDEDESGPSKRFSYLDKANLALIIFAKSTLKAQHVRSYNFYRAMKEDIWDTKNTFRN